MKPLIIIENYGKTSQVIICGLKIGCALSEISYTGKTPKEKTPHVKIDIDIINMLHLIANLNEDEIKEISETIKTYIEMYGKSVACTETIMQATEAKD